MKIILFEHRSFKLNLHLPFFQIRSKDFEKIGNSWYPMQNGYTIHRIEVEAVTQFGHDLKLISQDPVEVEINRWFCVLGFGLEVIYKSKNAKVLK